MVQKRSYYDEELNNICSKHPRQVEHHDRLVSFSECIPPVISPKGDEGFANDIITRPPASAGKDRETTLTGCNSIPSWPNRRTGEENFHLEPQVCASFPMECFSPAHSTRKIDHFEDTYSFLLHSPPQKAVPIGSNYQADIPEWGVCDKNLSKFSLTSEAMLDIDIVGNEDEKRLMGTCVIPMPSLELADEIANSRTNCSCVDEGSIRCVRQHIAETREELKRTLGQATFVELGFCDMGEEVEGNWCEEEVQLFLAVVFSNPVSLDKNFWDHLSVVFPYRTKEDIVSYYFNVFMLRRRAQQNRFDQMTIDSDSDEWQGDDYADNEIGTTEGDEDSVVDSPVYQDDCASTLGEEDDSQLHDEGAAGYAYSNNRSIEFSSGQKFSNSTETYLGKSLCNYVFNPISHHLDKIPWDKKVDQEIQAGSCTSCVGVCSGGTLVKVESDDHWLSSSLDLSARGGQEYLFQPCDPRVWDAGYMMCPNSKVDFLPTCSMIEEVFRDE